MPYIVLMIPVVMIVLAPPLILRWVPRNYFYGFRTTKTLADERVWYEANQGAGWDLFIAGLVQLGLTALRPVIPALGALPAGQFICLVQLPVLAVALGHSFWRLSRL